MPGRKLYFISHPEVEINPDVPVTEWGLSEIGRERFNRFLQQSWVKSITAIYCSGEQKAIDSAMLLAAHLALSYQDVHELGENDRSSTGYLPAAEFEEVADQFFANAETSVRGWETACDAQRRIVDSVTNIIANDETRGNIAIVSHGAVGTLMYCHFNNIKIDRRWDQPGAGGGNYMIVENDAKGSCTRWQPIDVFGG